MVRLPKRRLALSYTHTVSSKPQRFQTTLSLRCLSRKETIPQIRTQSVEPSHYLSRSVHRILTPSYGQHTGLKDPETL
jgi:hypothetical protein